MPPPDTTLVITVDVPADPQLVPLLRAAGNRPWDAAATGALTDRLEETGREDEAGWVRAYTAPVMNLDCIRHHRRRRRQRCLRYWKRRLYGRFGAPLTEIPLCEAADTPAGATPPGG